MIRVLPLLLAAVLVAPSASAQVLGVVETSRTNSAGNCHGARPIDREALRFRPLAVVNEYGTASAFVTCAFTSTDNLLGISAFGVAFTNLGTSPQTVSCTGVVGEEGSPRYYTKALTLAPQGSGTLAWSGNDNGNLLFGDRLSVSCLVPPQVGLNDNFVTALLPLL
jgi:hypothetical protein